MSPPGNSLSPATAKFLLELLLSQQVAMNAPDVEQIMDTILTARRELLALVAE